MTCSSEGRKRTSGCVAPFLRERAYCEWIRSAFRSEWGLLFTIQEDRRALFMRVYIYNSRCGFIQAGIFGGEECQTCRLSLLEGLTREALTSSID
jgi:hypothetical protein